MLRVVPNHGYPSEKVVRLSLQYQQQMNLSNRRGVLLLTKLLSRKIATNQDPKYQPSRDCSKVPSPTMNFTLVSSLGNLL
jgi:hypothetical protein